MELYVNPVRSQWNSLCQRNIPGDEDIAKSVEDIISTVRKNGDKALLEYAERFDHVSLSELTLQTEMLESALESIPQSDRKAMENAAENIRKFHAAQQPAEVKVETQPGVTCIQRPVAISRVGIYIPGGRAPLFSTVLMLAIPASLSGCKEIALFTPAVSTGISPYILAAAALCGITEVHPIGGAQAIAAMAYGTETIHPVNKIFGPGNRFVTKAKQLVSSTVAIDMPAGPSEVMVVADDSANPSFCAADMLSQAEHGPDSQAILVCNSEEFAENVRKEVIRQQALLKRQDSVEASLSHSRLIVFHTREEMLDFANAYGSEHLILSVRNPWEAAKQITAAGSIFIGNMSPESAGDYASGTNHTLPTAGWARALSGVNIDSFIHKITYQEITPEGLKDLSATIIDMATAEGLDAHANAVKIRIEHEA